MHRENAWLPWWLPSPDMDLIMGCVGNVQYDTHKTKKSHQNVLDIDVNYECMELENFFWMFDIFDIFTGEKATYNLPLEGENCHAFTWGNLHYRKHDEI